MSIAKQPSPSPHAGSVGQPAPRAPKRFLRVIVILCLVLFAVGTLPRIWHSFMLNRTATEEKQAIPEVQVVTPKQEVEAGVTLPGNIQGAAETSIQARTSGYVQSVLVDIGSTVTQGQLLATITAPDVDQQYIQAQAQTAQSQAAQGQAQSAEAHSRQQLQVQRDNLLQQQSQLKLAQQNFKRNWDLYGMGYMAKQDAETALSTLRTARANVLSAQAAIASAQADVASAQKGVTAAEEAVHAARANERRYLVMKGFEQVKAPFAGVITTRNIDPGTLITAGGSNGGVPSGSSGASGPSNSPASAQSATSSSGLFQLSNTDRVRIEVQVPETFAPAVQGAASTADVTIRELPGQHFTGTVTLRSGAIDPNSRTLQAEIILANPKHALLPGMFAKVELKPQNPPQVIRVPDSALIVDAQGTRVALVGDNNRVQFQAVRVGRDFGTESEIAEGLTTNERVINNPSDQLAAGQVVKVPRQ